MPHAKAPGGGTAPSATTTAAVSPEPLAMWTRSDDKLLEMLIVQYFPPQWDIIASRLVGNNKTPEQAFRRYERTVDQVKRVLQALQVETSRDWDTQMAVAASPAVPPAAAEVTVASEGRDAAAAAAKGKARVPASCAGAGDTSAEPSRSMERKKRGGERKKPEKWTEQEHNLFLEGLEKYGTGKWKTMSSEYLTTKSASEIASHHQKYRKRLEQRKRNGCKRASIHDVTEPTTSAAAATVVADGEELAAQKDGLGRGVEPKATDDLTVGAVEEFPDQDDFGTLFM
ncbi:hypothetical protein QOZ80_1BG0091400 [Eleusine coracana subsp. coracana]|nr:hypothetical protein QOZ80_1BG0091400 [Eleusine coracana subsp. coracana]